jgi:hypothetical protein
VVGGRSRRIHSRAGWPRSIAKKTTEPTSAPASLSSCRRRRRCRCKWHRPIPARLFGPGLWAEPCPVTPVSQADEFRKPVKRDFDYWRTLTYLHRWQPI